jgi:hypothetical protein
VLLKETGLKGEIFDQLENMLLKWVEKYFDDVLVDALKKKL